MQQDNMLANNTKEGIEQYYLNNDVSRARTGLLLLLIPLVVYVYNDYQFLGLNQEFYYVLALRAGLIVYTILMVFYLRRVKTPNSYKKSLFSYTSILMIIVLIIFSTRPQNFASQIVLIILTVFIFYLVIPNRFVYQTVPALIGIVGEIALIVLFVEISTLNFFSAFVLFFIALAIAASSAWQIQRYRQKGYQEMSKREQQAFELRESEEHFRTLAEESPNMIFINQEGRIVYVNKKSTDIVGYSKEEFYSPSFNFLTLSSPEYVEKVRSAWAKHLNGEDIPPYEYTLVTREGKRIDAFISTKLIDYKGKKAILGIVTDISELKKAEEALKESEERLKRSQEIAHLGSWELDLKQDRLTWSDEVYRIFGLKPQEFGASYEAFLAYVHPDDRTAVDEAYIGSVREGKDGYEIDHRVVRKDNGEVRFVHEKCNHVRSEKGQVVKSLGMVHDITERKKAEEALKQAQEKLQEHATCLERLVEERTKQLNNAERLAAIGATAGMVGHDIRNPLQAIVSELFLARQVMAEAPEGKDKQEALDSLGFVEEQVNYINKIVSDLQDYARPLNPEYAIVDLPDLLVSIFDAIVLPDKIKLRVDVKSALKVKTDPTFVKRAISNLVNNAIQAMPDGGELGLAAQEKEECVVISISDTGARHT